MAWNEFHIITTGVFAPEISDQLTALGAVAVTFLDAGDQPIFEPNPEKIELWQNTKITALFDTDHPLDQVITYLENETSLGKIKQFHIQPVKDEDWERKCLEGFTPICCGKRLWICPSWHTPPDKEAVNVLLDPGLAFGTGTHPTTKLCLEWLDKNIHQENLVIDYGCGSGILGIAAIKLGAKKVIAIDNDPQALEATIANRNHNQIPSDHLITQFPDQIIIDQADIVIANILALPLIQLASHLSNLVKTNGKLVLSGILLEQILAVQAAYQLNFYFEKPQFFDNWVILQGLKKK